MNKKLVTVLLSALLPLSFSVNAESALDFIKKTPATKYEVGKLQLEFLASFLNQGVQDEKLDGTHFRFRSVTVDETPNYLNLKAQLEGRAKYVSEEECEDIRFIFMNKMGLKSISSELWPDLTPSQQKELDSVVDVSVQLFSRENDSFTVSC